MPVRETHAIESAARAGNMMATYLHAALAGVPLLYQNAAAAINAPGNLP